MTEPVAETPEWTVSRGELVALGSWASSHVGHPAADQWWESLDEHARGETVAAGVASLNARDRDPAFATMLAVRREAALVLTLQPVDGSLVIAHLDDAGRVVIEREVDERGVRFLLTDQEDGMTLLASALTVGRGAVAQAVRFDTPGGREVGIYPLGDGQWKWTSGEETLTMDRSALPGALAILATAASMPA